jgi:phage shock protein E
MVRNMKQFIWALIAFVTLTACSQAEPDMAEWLATGVVIDTRTLDEFNAGHVQGAELIPYDQIRQGIASVAPDKQTPVILYCRSGRRAGIAEQVLVNMGYEKVINVGGLPEIKAFMETYRP